MLLIAVSRGRIFGDLAVRAGSSPSRPPSGLGHAPVGALGVVCMDDVEKGELAFGIAAGFFSHGRLFVYNGAV